MGKNWDKLKGHSDVKQDINRRDAKQGEILGNDGKKLEKRINDIRKVIRNPDVWNVNIASRDRMDEVEGKLDDLISRINGVSYIMKNIINSRKLTHEDIQTHLERGGDDNGISGSSN